MKLTVEEIKQQMSDLGFNQKQMAKHLGIKPARLNHWLKGVTKMRHSVETVEEALALLPKLPDSEYQWAAGFVEADGCISISKSGGRDHDLHSLRRFHVVLVVVQKDPRPPQLFKAMFGGSIKPVWRKHKGQNVLYNQWIVTANEAAAAITKIVPFMRFKREQAIMGIALQENINAHRHETGRYVALSDNVVEFRRDLYLKCKRLNSKTYLEDLNAASGEFGEHLSETTPSQVAEGSKVLRKA